jgi:hypothetical protein
VPADEVTHQRRAERLASALASSWHEIELAIPADWIQNVVNCRYATREWLESR